MAQFTTQPLKRSREEEQEEETQQIQANNNNNNTKRHKSSYNDILSILEEEEYGSEADPACARSGQPGSDIFTTLQQELLQSEEFGSDPVPVGSGASSGSTATAATATISGSVKEDEAEDGRSSVMRHLLEASDDELGIPSGDGTNGGDLMHDVENGINGDDFPFALCDGLWEFEDGAADFYYSLLQSELFM